LASKKIIDKIIDSTLKSIYDFFQNEKMSRVIFRNF